MPAAGSALVLVVALLAACQGRGRSGDESPPSDGAVADAAVVPPDAGAGALSDTPARPPLSDVPAPPADVSAEARLGCDVGCQYTLVCVLREPSMRAACVTSCIESLPTRSAACIAAHEAVAQCGAGMLCAQLLTGTCDRELSAISDDCRSS